MKFEPEKYRIADEPMKPFIDTDEINDFLAKADTSRDNILRIINKSLDKNRLSMPDVAALVQTESEELIKLIKDGAKQLKEKVYGNRIVLFAPLYVGNLCSNNCEYCGFKSSNTNAIRKTLTHHELVENVKALEQNGQKRLILVFGEHKKYDADYIAEAVKSVYTVKSGNGEIRRVNINAAPLDIEGFRKVHEAGIGTYQVFQETYHPEAYKKYHKSGNKSNYENRQIALDKAQEAGLDDVGIGALFGLYDWKFEVLGLLRHVNHLEACYNIGPHTISFPRITDTVDFKADPKYALSEAEFGKMVAILRLAVPYTGLILTAREPKNIRKEVLQYGCSQIDAGTKIELGAYEAKEVQAQNLNREQFLINDDRALSEVIDELLDDNYLPSFCTACYRKGRTGEHFMEFSVPGFIKKYCSPNAMLTLAEYAEDYASPEVYEKAQKVIEKNLKALDDEKLIKKTQEKLELIKQGKRDLYF
jgi:2-iminoacetate synthase